MSAESQRIDIVFWRNQETQVGKRCSDLVLPRVREAHNLHNTLDVLSNPKCLVECSWIDETYDFRENANATVQRLLKNFFFRTNKVVLLQTIVYCTRQRFGRAGFRQKTKYMACVDGRDRGFEVGIPGERELYRVRTQQCYLAKQLDAVRPGHAHIRNHDGK